MSGSMKLTPSTPLALAEAKRQAAAWRGLGYEAWAFAGTPGLAHVMRGHWGGVVYFDDIYAVTSARWGRK